MGGRGAYCMSWSVLELSTSYSRSGTSPTLTMNWLRSAGQTVTVTRSGVSVWSKPVRKISKTVASCARPKNDCSFVVRNARRDPVAVADLPDADAVGQVADGSLLDVLGHQQAGGSLGDEVHRVEGRLQRPWDAVDVTLSCLLTTCVSRRDTESSADLGGRYLDLDLGDGDARAAVALVDLGQVRGSPRSPPSASGFAVSTVTNGSILRVTKVPCPGLVSTRPWLVSRLIASLMVFRDEEYRSRSSSSVGSWAPGSRAPGLDLSAQVLGDLLVHRPLSHEHLP